jgi:hypothetical protein
VAEGCWRAWMRLCAVVIPTSVDDAVGIVTLARNQVTVLTMYSQVVSRIHTR